MNSSKGPTVTCFRFVPMPFFRPYIPAVFHDYGERYSCDYIQLAFELLLLSPPLPLRVVHLGAFNWLYEPATSFLYPESRPMPRSPN